MPQCSKLGNVALKHVFTNTVSLRVQLLQLFSVVHTLEMLPTVDSLMNNLYLTQLFGVQYNLNSLDRQRQPVHEFHFLMVFQISNDFAMFNNSAQNTF